MGIKTGQSKSAIAVLCLALLLVWVAAAFAESFLSTPATVDEINLKAKTMKVTYADPDSKGTKHVTALWDKSTEFLKEGPPPDMKETPAKPEDVKKGAKVHITITDKPVKKGMYRADTVRIKP